MVLIPGHLYKLPWALLCARWGPYILTLGPGGDPTSRTLGWGPSLEWGGHWVQSAAELERSAGSFGRDGSWRLPIGAVCSWHMPGRVVPSGLELCPSCPHQVQRAWPLACSFLCLLSLVRWNPYFFTDVCVWSMPSFSCPASWYLGDGG
jgi:hypothetical protein